MLEMIALPEISVVLGPAVGPMLGRAAGVVVGKQLGTFLKDRKERNLAEQACAEAFQEWLVALLKTCDERGVEGEYIQQLFAGYAEAIPRFFEDEEASAELLRPFTNPVPDPTLDHRLLIKRWQELNLPDLPEEFDGARACHWYVNALNSKRQVLELLRGHWQAQADQRRNELLAAMRGPWAAWNLDRYADAMRQVYQALDIPTLEMTGSQNPEDAPIRLKDVFIPQDARRSRRRRILPRDYLDKWRKLDAEVMDLEGLTVDDRLFGDDVELETHWEQTSRESFFDILTAADLQNLVILGDPGAGKSCVVRHMALCLLEGLGDEPVKGAQVPPWIDKFSGHLPLLIELRKFISWEERGGEHGFLGYLHHLGCDHGFGLNWADLDSKLRDAPSLVMFDGLDEIIDFKKRDHMADVITGFARRYPRTKVVVTSRVAGFDQRPFVQRASGFTVVTLDDLNQDQIECFSYTWFKLTLKGNVATAAERHRHLVESVRTRPPLAALAGNPLLLTILAIVARGRELPAERPKLYDHALRVFCHQWDFRRHVALPDDSPLRDLEEDDKLTLLRQVAWSMLEGGGLRANIVDKDHLEDAVCSYFNNEWWSDDTARSRRATREMIQLLQERNYVLCQQGVGRLFGFVHRTFLEYLCAAQLCWRVKEDRDLAIEDVCRDFVLPHAGDDSWREIIRLLVAQLQPKDAAQIIDALVEVKIDRWGDKQVREVAPALVLAIECLGEMRPKDRRHAETTRQAIVQRVSEDSSFAVRQVAIHALGQHLGSDPETKRLLIDRATKDDDGSVRSTAIRALAQHLGSDPEIKKLFISWAAKNDYGFVRSTAIRALSRHLGSDLEIKRLLIDWATKDSDLEVQHAAILTLGQHVGSDPV